MERNLNFTLYALPVSVCACVIEKYIIFSSGKILKTFNISICISFCNVLSGIKNVSNKNIIFKKNEIFFSL